MNVNTLGFEAWYGDVYPRLRTALMLSLGDDDVADESTDEAFARAFEKWDRVSAMDSPTGWLYRVGFNVARRRLRRRSLERRLLRREPIGHVEAPAGEMWAVVADLPERQRVAVVLRHVGQLREIEIAEVMGITRGTVSATLRAAYRSLRVELASELTAEEVK